MPTVWKAYAFIGLKLLSKQIEIKSEIPGCQHVNAAQLASNNRPNFCPECGKPAFRIENNYRSYLKEVDNIFEDPDFKKDSVYFIGKIGPWRIIRPHHGGDFFAVGSPIVANTCNQNYMEKDQYYSNVSAQIPLNEESLRIRDKMMLVFNPLDLWDPQRFGIFACLIAG